MSQRPILFSGDMVRAILDGRKTQTRRVLKPQPPETVTHAGQYLASHQPYDGEFDWMTGDPQDVDSWMMADTEAFRCPYGGVGDCLWIRETLYREEGAGLWHYKADDELVMVRPEHKTDMIIWAHHKEQEVCVSIHMPRWASRITLEIEDVRVERVQAISEEDAIAEGIGSHMLSIEGFKREVHKPRGRCVLEYRELWNKINAERGFGWETNPWVWAIAFKIRDQFPVAPSK